MQVLLSFSNMTARAPKAVVTWHREPLKARNRSTKIPLLRSEDQQDMDNADESSEEQTETSENSSEVLSDDTVHEVDEKASIPEVSDNIELFASSESDADSLHQQRKRGAASESHVKKKSRTEEKPP